MKKVCVLFSVITLKFKTDPHFRIIFYFTNIFMAIPEGEWAPHIKRLDRLIAKILQPRGKIVFYIYILIFIII